MHAAQQGALTPVLEAEALDGADEARRDDVVGAGTPAAEAFAPEEAGVGVHRRVEDGGGGLVVVAEPAREAAGLPLVQLAVLYERDEAALALSIGVGIMAPVCLQQLEPELPFRCGMVLGRKRGDALPVEALADAARWQAECAESWLACWQVLALAESR